MITNKDHWNKFVLMHQVPLYKFQINSNLGWNKNCGIINTENLIKPVRFYQFSGKFHMFLSNFSQVRILK